MERGLFRPDELVHRLLGDDSRMARRTNVQVLVDAGAIGGADLAIDVRSHERIDKVAIRH